MSEASYIYERSELHIRAKRVTYTSEASYIYERSDLRAKRVTSEASYERSDLQVKRVTSEASINQLGVWGALRPPGKFFEFRTPESESERHLTNYFIIVLLLFY